MDQSFTFYLKAIVEAAVVAAAGPVVEAALARVLPEAIRRAATPEFLTRGEAAAFLGRSVRSLDRLRATGTLPYSKRGGRVVVATADLEAYLAAGRVSSVAGTERKG